MKIGRVAKTLSTVGVGLGLVAVQFAGAGIASASSRPVTSSQGHFSSGGPFSHFGHRGHHHGRGHFDGHGTYVCTSGDIPAGSYKSVTVTGVCYTPSGNVWIKHDLSIAPGALLDAVTPGDPTSGTPVVPATVDVGGNVWVGKGAALLFGCSPNIACSNPPGISYDEIDGNLTADGAQGVVVHSAWIRGNVTLNGGGGGAAADTCNAQDPSKPTDTTLVPWSLDPSLAFTPVYSDFEDTSIGGNLKIMNLDSCWLATLRVQLGGNYTLSGNKMGDPDAMEVGSNVIDGKMSCDANSPAVQFGDGGAAPSVVRHKATGQCDFSVTVPNPSADAGGPGVAEHVSVSAKSLSTSTASYTSTEGAALPPVTTSSGDVINASLDSFVLSGAGLTGSGTYDPTKDPGTTGAAILSTTFPNGWSSFTGFLTCDCSFGGQSGTVAIRVYGTTSPSGATQGTFLVVSGGGLAPGSLSTLAAYGSFTSKGQPDGTLAVTEHAAIT